MRYKNLRDQPSLVSFYSSRFREYYLFIIKCYTDAIASHQHTQPLGRSEFPSEVEECLTVLALRRKKTYNSSGPDNQYIT